MNIYSYNQGSASARLLRDALGVSLIRHQNSRYRGSPQKMVINWGSGSIDNPQVLASRVLNSPQAVNRASNKLRFFQHINDSNLTPQFTTNIEEALEWAGNSVVYARTMLNAHSGAGIVLAGPDLATSQSFYSAPLYTRRVGNTNEFRVHVGPNGHFLVQEKRRRTDEENPNWLIRSHDNGFNFARGLSLPEVPAAVTDVATTVVRLLGLDFGAADVAYDRRTGSARVIEVNTAPGLTGTTVTDYANMFRSL